METTFKCLDCGHQETVQLHYNSSYADSRGTYMVGFGCVNLPGKFKFGSVDRCVECFKIYWEKLKTDSQKKTEETESAAINHAKAIVASGDYITEIRDLGEILKEYGNEYKVKTRIQYLIEALNA